MITNRVTSIGCVAVIALGACTRPPARAPIALPDTHSSRAVDETASIRTIVATRSSSVVIMSMHDVEPYERVPPPTPKQPPEIEYAAPLYGALAGAVTGVMLNTGLTLLTEHRWPNDRKYDRERANKALLYGAGLGLAAGTFALANSISERLKWRERRRLRQQPEQQTEQR